VFNEHKADSFSDIQFVSRCSFFLAFNILSSIYFIRLSGWSVTVNIDTKLGSQLWLPELSVCQNLWSVFNVYKHASSSNKHVDSHWSYFLKIKSPHLDLPFQLRCEFRKRAGNLIACPSFPEVHYDEQGSNEGGPHQFAIVIHNIQVSWEYDVSPCASLPYADLLQSIRNSQFAICASAYSVTRACTAPQG